jgi:hypothetical protein
MQHFMEARRLRHLAAAALALSASGLPVLGVAATDAGASPAAVCIPTVVDDAYSTPQDTALVVPDIGVVSNDSCVGDGLVISTSSPAHGTLDNFDDSDGGFTYTPDPGFSGVDSFTYVLEDTQDSPTATVTITVSPAATTTTTTTTPSTTAAPTTTVAPPPAVAAAAVSATPTYTG